MALAFARKSGRRPAAKPAKRAPPAPALAPAPLQAKLEVGPARDRFEQEADRVTDRIMRTPDGAAAPPPSIAPLAIQRKTAKPPPEETEPVQRAPEQREEEEIEPICTECALQRAADKAAATVTPDEEPEKKHCREEPLPGLQRKAADGAGPAPASVQSTVAHARAGGGAPLAPETRAFMEPRLGRDLSHVRVHHGAPAASAARAVGARAFTVGRDVFFGRSRYRPGTGEGRRLLAHELVHTIQQGGGSARAQPARIQRDGDAETKSEIAPIEKEEEDPKVFPHKTAGKIEAKPEKRKRGTMYLPALKIPFFNDMPKGASANGGLSGRPAPGKNKIQAGQAYQYLGPTDRSGRQREVWRSRAKSEFAASLQSLLPTRVEGWGKGGVLRPQEGGAEVHYLRRKGRNAPPIMIGTLESLARHELAVLPAWDEKGEIATFDVDHLHELQLGGLDDWDNLWMLESSANRSSGSIISNDLEKRIGALIAAGRSGKFWTEERGGAEPSVEEVRLGWRLMIESFQPPEKNLAGRPELHHTRDDVKAGEHLGGLRALDDAELGQFGLEPGDKPKVLLIFPGPEGGFPKPLRLDKAGVPQLPQKAQDRFGFYRGFFVAGDGLQYRPPTPEDAEGAQVGAIRGLAFKKKSEKGEIFEPAPVEMPLKKASVLGLNVYIDRTALFHAVRNLKVKGMSLLAVDEAGITADGALFANGRILATKALFPGLEIPVQLLGDEVFVNFSIPTDRLKLGPLAVTDANLRIGAGADGLFVAGGAAIAIDGLGHGSITATASKGGAKIAGGFEFDLAFLEGTSGKFSYDFATDALSLTLEKDVKKGALPGVASGHISVTISRGAAEGATAAPPTPAAAGTAVAMSGELMLAGPLAGTVVTVAWNPEEGVVIGADDIPLPVSKIPGVSNATVSVRARRNRETGEWRVSGGGAADLAMAGVTGKLSAAVDGAAVSLSGTGRFAKGPVTGSVSFRATNQKLDAEGNPVPGEAAEEFTVSGKGGAEVQLGKILRGAAALEVTPDARVIITGTIGLPPTFPVFPIWEDKKELFRLEPPDFPIWGVSIAGFGIGIFAFVDATFTFDAFVGPGIIRNASVCITFELDKPEETVVEGGGEFYVPAGAGLTIDLGGGIKAKVLTAEAKGRVGLDGRLGILAEGKAGVGIRWTPQEGLSLGAEIEGKARPQFELNANASVTVSVDLGLWEPSKTWGPWKEPLGKFGPELELGITAPVAWSEASGLDFDLDKIAVKRPDIDAADLMKSAFDRLV